MGWEAEQNGAISGSHLPMRALHQSVTLHWKEDQEVEAHTFKYTATLPDIPGIMWPELTTHLGPASVREHGDVYTRLLLPFDRALAHRIEDWRQGRSAAVRIEIRGNVVFRRINKFAVPDGPKKEPSPGQVTWQPQRHLLMSSALEQDQVYTTVNIDRDHWISILAAIGWDEFSVFEVPVLSLKRHEQLQKGLALLAEAQSAFRQGQWSTVVTDARRALEAAAGIAAPNGDRRAKFEALLAQVLPADRDEPKRDTLGGLMLALKDLRDHSAHVIDVRFQVEREDAELALTVAISIFRFMGEALARAARRRE
jgi:hypothetical protein